MKLEYLIPELKIVEVIREDVVTASREQLQDKNWSSDDEDGSSFNDW